MIKKNNTQENYTEKYTNMKDGFLAALVDKVFVFPLDNLNVHILSVRIS